MVGKAYFTRAFVWFLIFVVAVVVGVTVQCVLFKSETNTVADALKTWPGLWVVYFLFSLALGERIYKRMARPRPK